MIAHTLRTLTLFPPARPAPSALFPARTPADGPPSPLFIPGQMAKAAASEKGTEKKHYIPPFLLLHVLSFVPSTFSGGGAGFSAAAASLLLAAARGCGDRPPGALEGINAMVVPPALEEDGGGWIAAPLVGWFCWGKKPLALLLLLLLYEAAFPPPPISPGEKKRTGETDFARSKHMWELCRGVVSIVMVCSTGEEEGETRGRNNFFLRPVSRRRLCFFFLCYLS